MSKLQDLNLSETLLEQLPTLSSLKSLKHLSLRGCGHLESIPPLEALHKLEILDLSQTAVRHLPSLGNLSNLHTLLLRDCSNLEDFKKNKMLDMSGVENLPCGISRLTQLEHLALPRTKKNNEADESNKVISWQQNPGESHWFFSIVDGIEPNIGRSLMFHDDSLFLEFLQSNPSLLDANSNHFDLSIHPIEVHDGAGDLLFKKDELIFRDVYLLSRHYSRSQGQLMEIHHLNTFPKGAEAVLGNAEYVFLFDNLFLKSLSDLGARNIKMMKGCWIEGCQNMGSVIGMDDSVESSELGNALEILWISNAFSLRSVYSEHLQNLKCLYLDCCPKLSRVFSSSHLLQKLEILHVKFCENLEALFKDDVEEQKLPNSRTLRLWELPALKCIGCIVPSLQLLDVGECRMLRHVLTSGLVPEKLEVLKLKNCHELDKILEGVTSDYNKLPQLGEVHLQGLPKLTSIGIEAPLLRSLEVRDCSLLIHVISSTHKPENLEVLKVRFCDNLETLFAGTSEDCILPSLDKVQLWGLPKLVSIGTTLPPLRKSIIRDCPKLTIPMS